MATIEKSEQLSRYWHEQITAWEHSGKSQKAFCEQHDLNYHRFGYWRRKFVEQAQEYGDKPCSGFVPVERSHPGSMSGLSLRLPNGVVIQGIDQNNLAVVSQLLRQL
jgi:hypothetical protein